MIAAISGVSGCTKELSFLQEEKVRSPATAVKAIHCDI